MQRAPGPVRTLVSRIPEPLQPQPTAMVGVAALDPSGRVVHQGWGHIDGIPMLTGVREAGGVIWLGSQHGAVIARLTI